MYYCIMSCMISDLFDWLNFIYKFNLLSFRVFQKQNTDKIYFLLFFNLVRLNDRMFREEVMSLSYVIDKT